MERHETRILLVEDEEGLVMTLGDRLRSEGYFFEAATDGTRGFTIAKEGDWDLLILDVMLPGKNGYDICRDLRAAGSKVPILMLTARGLVFDRVLGLKLGADDYLCKPFETSELLARIEALLRRPPLDEGRGSGAKARDDADPSTRGREKYDGFSIDFTKGVIIREDQEEALSAQEYKLLAWLSAHPGELFSRERLLQEVWGYGSPVSTRTVDVHVAWLRQKLGDSGPAPRHIVTVRGLGYRFTP
ncbi:MAG TPA: response regulator transcription factor [Rectinemataceae bacterium]|nr:response regulator transcription factor [Rectinemataceae bacterium]